MNIVKVPIGKTETEREVDFDGLPENVQAYVIEYGLRQILNDAHSTVTEKAFPDPDERAEQVEALVDAKLKAMLAGDVSIRNVTRDPVKARMLTIALRHVQKVKTADGKVDVKATRAAAEAILKKKGPLYRDLAESQIRAEKELGAYDPEGDNENE